MDERDPIEARLRALRPLSWTRVDHQRRLEMEIMERSNVGASPWMPRLATVAGLLLAGGVAGAAGATLVERWVVETEDLPGDSKRVTITDSETGAVFVDTFPDEPGSLGIELDPEPGLELPAEAMPGEAGLLEIDGATSSDTPPPPSGAR